MEPRNENIIVLDDVTSPRQRIVGLVVVLLIIAAIAFPLVREFELNETVGASTASSNPQSVLDMCGRWDVPEMFQPLANAAYPAWNWVCRLAQE